MTPAPRTPQWILEKLSAAHRSSIGGGGSGASTFLVDSAAGRLVVKVGDTGSTLVDGHRGEDLVSKWRQLQLIWEQEPPIRSLYAEPLRLLRTGGQVALVCAYYEASSVLEIVETTNKIPDLSALFGTFLRPSVSSWIRKGTSSDGRLAHLDRVRRRVSYVATYAPEWLEITEYNGLCVPHVNWALSFLESEPMIQKCTPGYVHFPFHGDMNMQNILWSAAGPKLIDVRGVTTAWDLVYDIGKLIFDVLAYHDIARRHQAHVSLRRWDQARAIRDQVAGSELGAWLTAHDSSWEDRLAVTVVLHAFCESACRLSMSMRSTTAAQADVSAGRSLWCRGLQGLAAVSRMGADDDLPGLLALSEVRA
jgi:hypothetical protein